MLSVRKLFQCASLITFALLQACTFGQLYDERVQGSLSKIFVSTISNRNGQILRNRLRYLFEGQGDVDGSLYTLDITLTVTDNKIGVDRSGVAVRKNKVVKATLALKDRRTREIIYRNTLKAENSYVVLGRQFYSNPITEDYATKQALELLAQFIQTDLAMYFSKNEN